MRCATASSMPTCIRETCSSTMPDSWSRSISASWAGSGCWSAASLRKFSTASSPATTCASPRCISRPATCRHITRSQNFAQAIRAIGEPIHNRTAQEISMAKLLTLLFEVTGTVRHADAPRVAVAAEDHGGGRGRRARLRSQARHLDHGGAGGARMDRAQSRTGRPYRRRGRAARATSARSSPACPAIAARSVALLERSEAITRNGLLLAPETVEAIGRARRPAEPLADRRHLGHRHCAWRPRCWILR